MGEKKSKAEVDYGPGHYPDGDYCGICKHFRRPRSCELVEGTIGMKDWCELFEKR